MGESREDAKRRKSAARLFAVQALYQMETSGEGLDQVLQEFEDLRFGADYDIGPAHRRRRGGDARLVGQIKAQVAAAPANPHQSLHIRGAFDKILRSPLGGWTLQLESRERGS